MKWFYIAAAVICLLTLVAHGVLGTMHIAEPLLNAELAAIPKYVALFCWLAVGLMVFVMMGAFSFAAFNQGTRPLIIAMTSLAAGTAVINLLVIVFSGQDLLAMPQWIFFGLIAGNGILGLRS